MFHCSGGELERAGTQVAALASPDLGATVNNRFVLSR